MLSEMKLISNTFMVTERVNNLGTLVAVRTDS